jgi:hypothetical protein
MRLTLNAIMAIWFIAEGHIDEDRIEPRGKLTAGPCLRPTPCVDNVDFFICCWESMGVLSPDLHLLEHRDPCEAEIKARNHILKFKLR